MGGRERKNVPRSHHVIFFLLSLYSCRVITCFQFRALSKIFRPSQLSAAYFLIFFSTVVWRAGGVPALIQCSKFRETERDRWRGRHFFDLSKGRWIEGVNKRSCWSFGLMWVLFPHKEARWGGGKTWRRRPEVWEKVKEGLTVREEEEGGSFCWKLDEKLQLRSLCDTGGGAPAGGGGPPVRLSSSNNRTGWGTKAG